MERDEWDKMMQERASRAEKYLMTMLKYKGAHEYGRGAGITLQPYYDWRAMETALDILYPGEWSSELKVARENPFIVIARITYPAPPGYLSPVIWKEDVGCADEKGTNTPLSTAVKGTASDALKRAAYGVHECMRVCYEQPTLYYKYPVDASGAKVKPTPAQLAEWAEQEVKKTKRATPSPARTVPTPPQPQTTMPVGSTTAKETTADSALQTAPPEQKAKTTDQKTVKKYTATDFWSDVVKYCQEKGYNFADTKKSFLVRIGKTGSEIDWEEQKKRLLTGGNNV